MSIKRLPQSAYIDGGLAAMLLQGAIGGVLAAMFYLRGYLRNIKAWFTGGTAKANIPPVEEKEPEA